MVNNIYSLVNAELERLHALAERIEREDDQRAAHYGISSGASMGGPSYGQSNRLRNVMMHIDKINDIMIKLFESHDVKIQEKVAELALADVQKDKV